MRALPWLIFAVAFAIRLVHLWQIQPSPFFDVLLGDARGYDEWARRLAGGDWIGTEVFYQAPLYPYFLGGSTRSAGRDLFLVRLVQAALGDRVVRPAGDGRRPAVFTRVEWSPAMTLRPLRARDLLRWPAAEVRARLSFVCLALWLIVRGFLDGVSTRGSWLALGLAMGGLASHGKMRWSSLP